MHHHTGQVDYGNKVTYQIVSSILVFKFTLVAKVRRMLESNYVLDVQFLPLLSLEDIKDLSPLIPPFILA